MKHANLALDRKIIISSLVSIYFWGIISTLRRMKSVNLRYVFQGKLRGIPGPYPPSISRLDGSLIIGDRKGAVVVCFNSTVTRDTVLSPYNSLTYNGFDHQSQAGERRFVKIPDTTRLETGRASPYRSALAVEGAALFSPGITQVMGS